MSHDQMVKHRDCFSHRCKIIHSDGNDITLEVITPEMRQGQRFDLTRKQFDTLWRAA